jgi:hypothetical protein
MKLIKILVAILIGIVAIFTMPIPSSACSCAEEPTVEAELDRSAAVFRGVVLEKNPVNYSQKVLFEVKEIWKGIDQSQIIIQTGAGGGDCGFQFHTGQEYLIYASASKEYGGDYLVTSICDKTAQISASQDDLKILGQGFLPTQKVELFDELDRIMPQVVTIVIWVGIGGFILITFFVVRRLLKNAP